MMDMPISTEGKAPICRTRFGEPQSICEARPAGLFGKYNTLFYGLCSLSRCPPTHSPTTIGRPCSWRIY